MTQNRTNANFPVHKSSSATGASEQLLELRLLLKELSAAGAFSAASGMGSGPGRSCTAPMNVRCQQMDTCFYLESMLGKKYHLQRAKRNRDFEYAVPPVQWRPGPAPMPEAAENAPAADSSLSRSRSSSSCSEAPVAEDDL